MTFRTSTTLFPALLLAFFALATAGSAKTIAPKPAAVYPIQKNLLYRPAVCFKRSQFCCYKHEKCGQVCKPFKCITKKVCKAKLLKKCLVYKTVKICTVRCYTCLLYTSPSPRDA